LRTFAPFLRWVFGITIILSVMVCSYGVERGSGPVPVMTPALPLPRPLPAVLPVVPVPVICPFASPQMKDPAQTPTKMICESLDKFIVVSVEQGASHGSDASPAFLLSAVTPCTRGSFSGARHGSDHGVNKFPLTRLVTGLVRDSKICSPHLGTRETQPECVRFDVGMFISN